MCRVLQVCKPSYKKSEDENHTTVSKHQRTAYKLVGLDTSAIRCDNEPEYISKKLINWATKKKITLLYIQPGKPTQNAYIERFNRTVRHEWSDLYQFDSIEQAQLLATQWLWLYNNERPHTAIGGIPPRWLLKVP